MTGPLGHQWPLPKVEPMLAAALFDFLIKAATRVLPTPIGVTAEGIGCPRCKPPPVPTRRRAWRFIHRPQPA